MPRLIFLSLIIIPVLLGILVHPGFLGLLGLAFILTIIQIVLVLNGSDNTILGITYLFKTKKIKTQFGRFCIFIDDNNGYIYLYRDIYICYIHITEFKFTNIDEMQKRIKSHTDSIYKDKIDKKEFSKKIKEWSGYLDKQSERDSKLEKIIYRNNKEI